MQVDGDEIKMKEAGSEEDEEEEDDNEEEEEEEEEDEDEEEEDNEEGEGDFLLSDMGQGIPMRPGELKGYITGRQRH